MKILITAATAFELDVVNSYRCEGKEKKHTIDLQVTGLGSVATAYTLAKTLSKTHYDLAINIGIAGSFSDKHPIGSVVAVTHECFADLGVREDSGFKTIFDMRLLTANDKPFTNGWLHCPYTDSYPLIQKLPKAKSVTVNTVTGMPTRVEELKKNFAPDIESMEGAAFFYVCLLENTPFLQIRSISNMVGERNKQMWDIPMAVDRLRELIDKAFHVI